jgi:hypothetical protein
MLMPAPSSVLINAAASELDATIGAASVREGTPSVSSCAAAKVNSVRRAVWIAGMQNLRYVARRGSAAPMLRKFVTNSACAEHREIQRVSVAYFVVSPTIVRLGHLTHRRNDELR